MGFYSGLIFGGIGYNLAQNLSLPFSLLAHIMTLHNDTRLNIYLVDHIQGVNWEMKRLVLNHTSSVYLGVLKTTSNAISITETLQRWHL